MTKNTNAAAHKILNAIDSMTTMGRKVFVALVRGLYAEPGFSDVDAYDIAEATSYATTSVRTCLQRMGQKDLVIADHTDINDRKACFYLPTFWSSFGSAAEAAAIRTAILERFDPQQMPVEVEAVEIPAPAPAPKKAKKARVAKITLANVVATDEDGTTKITCVECLQVMPLDAFYRNRANVKRHGRSRECKPCLKAIRAGTQVRIAK